MEEIFYVKIISSKKKTYWYDNMIGFVIPVYDYDESSYEIATEEGMKFLDKVDCVKVLVSNI